MADDNYQRAANRTKEIAKYNAATINEQLKNQLAAYSQADNQNRNFADTETRQARRKAEGDRFDAQRSLQDATTGILGALGPAGNGVSYYNLMRMLANRNDTDNNTYWGQAQRDIDAIENEYIQNYNQNNLARLDAVNNAQAQIRGINADLAANLNNLSTEDQDFYQSPNKVGFSVDKNTGTANIGNRVYEPYSGYYRMPAVDENNVREQVARNMLQGNDYFSQLMNAYNTYGTAFDNQKKMNRSTRRSRNVGGR